MNQVLICIAAGAVAFLSCAVLRWLPARAISKVVLLVYFLAVGAWAGLWWSRLTTEMASAKPRLSTARFEAALEEVWPTPRPAKVTSVEIERILDEVVRKTVAGYLGPDQVVRLQNAGREILGQRRMVDRHGYADTSEVVLFITDILPRRLQDRIAARLPDRRARVFGYSFLLALLGVAAGAVTSGMSRKAATRDTADV